MVKFEGYDVIGDVHGHADKLVALLDHMGYREVDGVWCHTRRQAVFVGDLIDNGPRQLTTVEVVRAMEAAGTAIVAMGNHEFNAIAWHRGQRERTEKNQKQHSAFLAEVGDGSALHAEIVEWFARLPLWLDLGELRVIHACWDDGSMAALAPHLVGNASLSESGLRAAATRGTPEYEAVEILLKGPEVALPRELHYLDKSRHPRDRARYEWWSEASPTYLHRAHLPSDALDLDGRPHPGFPDTELPEPIPLSIYDGPPVIFGHYWQSGSRRLTSPQTVCVDYSAGKGGPLVAYRWSGERTLTATNLVAVDSPNDDAACGADQSFRTERRHRVTDQRVITATQRAIGCVVGSAVGDALGAPFEFGPAGAYTARFPAPVIGGIGEMVGGGAFGWAPGQFTDDNEMAVIVAESLLAHGGIDADDQLARFRAWGAVAADVGNLTRSVLNSGLPADRAAVEVFGSRGGRGAAGNGSLMRAAPGAVFFASKGRDATMAAGRQLSAITHADPLCQWAVAVQHEAIRVLLDGGDLDVGVVSALEAMPADVLQVYLPLLDVNWTPEREAPGNGSAMGALAQAVWAVRTFTTFADVMTHVIDLGGDTDSVAAVAGSLAGARFGIQAIPTRWLTYVHGEITQIGGGRTRYDHLALQRLALSLFGRSNPVDPPDEPLLEPAEVVPGLWATNRAGAREIPDDWATISLCRVDDSMRRPLRREAYLIDKDGDSNPSLPEIVDDLVSTIAAFRAEGRPVVVHCHGGRSRTGLVLAAYLMHEGHSLEQAQTMLADRWPHAHFVNRAFVAELARRA